MALLCTLAGMLMCVADHHDPIRRPSIQTRELHALWPFGRAVVRRPDAGAPSVIGNIIWVVLVGWELAIGHLIAAALLTITIIGIPLALAKLKLVPSHSSPSAEPSFRPNTPGRPAQSLSNRRVTRVRDPPPQRRRDPRLAHEANGHDRDLAVDRPKHRTRRRALRSWVTAARAPVPRRRRHLRRARRDEAIILNTPGGQPHRTQMLRARLPHAVPDRIGTAYRHPFEIGVHATSTLDQLVPDPPARRTSQSVRGRGGN
jgi:uncharacterized membrane protein YccF (DUF307 family)